MCVLSTFEFDHKSFRVCSQYSEKYSCRKTGKRFTKTKEHLNDISSVRVFGRIGPGLSVYKINFNMKTMFEWDAQQIESFLVQKRKGKPVTIQVHLGWTLSSEMSLTSNLK